MPNFDEKAFYAALDSSEEGPEWLRRTMQEDFNASMGKLRFVPNDQAFRPDQLNRIEAKLDQLLELHGRPQSVIILADPQIDRIAAELKGK